MILDLADADVQEALETIEANAPVGLRLARSILTLPQPVQIVGILVLTVVVAAGGTFLWRRRRRIRARFLGASPAVKATVASIGLLVVVASAGAGYVTYDYVQHDNTFCVSCHVMEDAYVRFTGSEHAELGCHDCHQQPITSSVRQLALWVADRPGEIGEHGPVPDERCRSCHIDEPSEDWPQIAASVGHSVHFESDDPDLGEVMCVSCHGVSVHEFVPASTTCGECHEEAEIRLGRMTGASSELHCVVCHDFLGEETTKLPGYEEGVAMVPTREECLGCHEMEQRVIAEEFATEPHGGVCGACHNPHIQTEPLGAATRCVDCHQEIEENEFHQSLHDVPEIQANCARCHMAHTWEADMLECLDCHAGVPRDDLSPPGRRREGRDGVPIPAPVSDAAAESRLRRLGPADVDSAPPRAR